MASWREVMRDAAASDPDGDPMAVAASAIGRLDRGALISMAAEEIAWQQRALVRDSEMSAFRLVQSTGSKVDMDTVKALVQITGSFQLGNGERVSWRHATVDQLRQRRDFMARMRSGLDASIARLDVAIEAIEAAGVTCIADLDDLAA